MSLIDNIAAVCLPVVSVSRNKKDALMIAAEEGLPLRNTEKVLEQRVNELEKKSPNATYNSKIKK